ncbi:hypothetical protein [Sorangium sp. So ce542]|uniref:hypothetical protein n=1 Tax=Sorangium sp. So ce542 TaxID=3133316 RepID=UPI003F5E3FDF
MWLADDPEPQRWFIEHANGRPFREIAGLPVRMTRRMEHILLTSPPHLSLQAAMRRAEILALDGPPELVDTILTTDLAVDLGHGDLWREALRFRSARAGHRSDTGVRELPRRRAAAADHRHVGGARAPHRGEPRLRRAAGGSPRVGRRGPHCRLRSRSRGCSREGCRGPPAASNLSNTAARADNRLGA